MYSNYTVVGNDNDMYKNSPPLLGLHVHIWAQPKICFDSSCGIKN